MSYLVKIIKGIDKIVELSARFAAWLFIPLVLTLVYEVVMRYVFRAPTAWSYEVSYFISSFILIVGMAYTLQVKQHVGVDLFYNMFPARVQAIVNILCILLLFMPLWIVVLSALIPYAYQALITGERNQVGFWYPIIWPFRFWIVGGVILLVMQGISDLLRNTIILIKGSETK